MSSQPRRQPSSVGMPHTRSDSSPEPPGIRRVPTYFRIPNSAFPVSSELRVPHSVLVPNSAFRIPRFRVLLSLFIIRGSRQRAPVRHRQFHHRGGHRAARAPRAPGRAGARSGERRGAAPRQHPPADARRRERRSLFFVRRPPAGLSVHPGRLRVRSHLHDERGRVEPGAREHRRRTDDVRVLLPGRQADPLRVDAPRSVPSARRSRILSRGYVWPIYESYDIYIANADGTGLAPLTRARRLRRRGHVGDGRPHRLHQRARRRHGDLLDGWRRRPT